MLKQLVNALPKAELHMHIEGSLEPRMMLDLARRNGVSLPYPDIDAVREAYRFGCLQDFLDLYYQGMSVLLEEQDFEDLAWAYLQRCREQNVVHCEVFFDPQGHTERGVAFDTVMRGLVAAFDRGLNELGITSRLIMCFLRHLDEDSAEETLERARPWRDHITGVGLDSSELGHPPGKFVRVFQRAKDLGFRRVAHAGEEGPPAYVREALDALGVDRIDHGNRALEDPSLVTELAQREVPLTVCPLSNLRLAVVDDLARHPVGEMLEQGLNASLHSDDPAYFGGYINENFHALIDQAGLTRDQILQLVRNGFRACFLPAEHIRAHLEAVDAVAESMP